MTKTELIDAIAKDAKITKTQAAGALESAISNISKRLTKGDTVTLVGFGTFSVTNRVARKGRNPQTGAVINIPASKSPRFKAGKKLKEAVN